MFTQTHIETNTNVDKIVLDDAVRAMSKSKQSKPDRRPDIWRIIMNSKIKKFVAAAVVLVAVTLSLVVMEKSTPTAMADVLEALHSVRYLHIKIFEADSEDAKEIWVEFDESGHVRNLRMNKEPRDATDGTGWDEIKALIWKEGKLQLWIPKENVLATVFDDTGIAKDVLNSVIELDPKHAIEILHEAEKKGDVVLDIRQPSNNTDPIIIEAEYPTEGSLAVLSIDQETKLLSSFKLYILKDGEYKYEKTIEYHDYNQPIDPAIFVLEDEVPEGTTIVDETTQAAQDAGIEQGDLSDKEIAVKMTREFHDAIIAKDYSKAATFWPTETPEEIERVCGRMTWLEVSIGEPTIDSRARVVKVPCVAKVEAGGQLLEFPQKFWVRQNQSGRWQKMGRLPPKK
jgi:hypothetical protein